MKFLLISPKNRTVYNFRGDLIKKIQSLGYKVYVTGPDQLEIEKVNALGVYFFEIPMNKTGTSIIGDLTYCLALYRLMKKEKFDASLGYTIKPVIYGSIAAKFAGIKNINAMVTGAGYLFSSTTLKAKLVGLIAKTLYKIGFACPHHIIFQNNDDKEEFIISGLASRKKCHVVNGSGVNMDWFQTGEPFPEEITFFMLSRLLHSKGVMEYLLAAKQVKAQYPQAKFLLLGSYDQLPDSIPKSVIEPYILDGTIQRFNETHDVRGFYEKCSVYVLPSYREGTPRTVLEAMAMGRPIITTDTPGCRETVVDGYNGYLVPVRDPNTLAEKMIQFIKQPELINTMGTNSLQLCREKFDVDAVNNQLTQIMNLS